MALWYLSRATGAATLVLLTLTLAIGIVNVDRSPRRGSRGSSSTAGIAVSRC